MPNTEKKPMHFVSTKTPYLDNMACFLVPLLLTFEIDIPYGALITGYFVFENIPANACASSTIFPRTDTDSCVSSLG